MGQGNPRQRLVQLNRWPKPGVNGKSIY